MQPLRISPEHRQRIYWALSLSGSLEHRHHIIREPRLPTYEKATVGVPGYNSSWFQHAASIMLPSEPLQDSSPFFIWEQTELSPLSLK